MPSTPTPRSTGTRWCSARSVSPTGPVHHHKADLVDEAVLAALKHRLLHTNPKAAIRQVDFGQADIKEIFDLRGFNLDAKLEIDPDFLVEAEDDHAHHDDKIKSFVYRNDRPFDPTRLEDFLGGILQIYGERLLRYKGVLYMKGVGRKVVFQGVHQMMGSDLAGKWMPIEKKTTKMVFIGIDLTQDLITDGLDACLA